MLNGLYAAQAQKRPGPAGRAVSEANFAVSSVAEKVIYLIPVFGILLVLASDGAYQVQHTRSCGSRSCCTSARSACRTAS